MKKFWAGLLIALSAACLAVGLSACGERPPHIWSEEWSNDALHHWHKCLDEGCTGRSGLANHDWVVTETAVAPTCVTEGYGSWKCETCGREKEDNIPVVEHTWTLFKVINEANCFQIGSGDYMCEVCQTHETFDIPATGEHVWADEWSHDASGHYHECQTPNCPARTEVIEHDMNNKKTTPVSGTKDGKIEYMCSVCNYVVRTEVLPSPIVPVSFDVAFTPEFSGAPDCTVTWDEKTNIGDVTLVREPQNGRLAYRIRFINGKNANGEPVAVEEKYDLKNTPGVRGFIKDEYTGLETLLDVQYSDKVMFLDGVFRVRKTPEGRLDYFTVIFRYYTGNEGDTVKATRTLHVHVVEYGGAAAVSAFSPLSAVGKNVTLFTEAEKPKAATGKRIPLPDEVVS